MEKKLVPCQNCDELYEEGFSFCPHCGQKTNDDLTIGVLFYNTISNYFSFDARFLKSFIPLMFKPGYLASRFIEGKRLMYLHPAQMYLFVSVIFFFIISFSTRDLVSKADEINQKVADSDVIEEVKSGAKTVLDSVSKEEILKQLENNPQMTVIPDEKRAELDSIVRTTPISKTTNVNWGNIDKNKVDSLVAADADDATIYKSMGMSDDAGFFERRFYKSALNLTKGSGAGSMVQAFFDSIPLAMFFLLPIFALILKVFYFNKGKYAHHLVFSFYYFSYLFTVFAVLFAVNRFIYDIPDWIDWLVALSTFIYFLIALIRFYRQNWFLSFIKSGVISFVFLMLIIPTAFIIILVFSFLVN